jgi:hypothetical protein
LNENRETEALAALNSRDIARLNEVMVIFGRFINYVERNSISFFKIFLMLCQLRVNFGSLRANKHAETLMQTVSDRLSRTTDLNVIFVCCLVTPARKNIMALLSDQARSPSAWKQCGSRASMRWPRYFLTMLLK